VIDSGKFALVVQSPTETFFNLYNKLAKSRTQNLPETFIEEGAIIHPSAEVAAWGVYISKGATVRANATVRERSILGKNSDVHEGAILGSDGFEYKRIQGSSLMHVLHDGITSVGSNCVIGANSVIGQGFWRRHTVLGENTKLDHLVAISHGAKLGESNLIAVGAVIAGSVTTGKNVWVGPGAHISNGLQIGDNAKIAMGSMVFRDVSQDTLVLGNPARPFRT
jgi:UDP-3-O-[3-hydroxymyristoyl] glucosamine N-acyltransferase